MLKNMLKRKATTTNLDKAGAPGHWSEGLYPPSEAMPLEPRIMLDGAAPAMLVDAIDELGADAHSVEVETHKDTQSKESQYPASTLTVGESKRNEVVIVDTTIDGYQELLSDLVGNTDELYWQTDETTGIESIIAEQHDRLVSIYAVDGQQSGLKSITEILSAQVDIDAVHVLSHGTEAGLIFNGSVIGTDLLKNNANAVASWGDCLTADGDILLYGCDTGVAGAGVEFVQQLSALTQADIAASDDPTGSSLNNGDWDLEVSSGPIETELVTEEQAQVAFVGLLSADPVATVDTPASGFINEAFEFTVTADNNGTDTGYSPYLNVFVEPGVNVNSASLFGSTLATQSYTWDAVSSSWLDSASNSLTEHPLDPAISLPAAPAVNGSEWILVDLPYGSYVPSQPPAEILFDATLDPSQGAALGQPIGITAQMGFELGEDPYNNPDTDAPIVGPLNSETITPTVLQIEKTADNYTPAVIGELENATGPNNPTTFILTVDLADGQTVDNILLSDVVPNNVHYLGSLTVAGSGSQVSLGTSDATIGVHNNNELTVSFASVTGTASDDDILITYQGYIPEVDANGDPILGATSGSPVGPVENTVDITGLSGGVMVSGSDTIEINPQAVAIQKASTILDSTGTTVARNTILPGDLLEWSLTIQVSDYFSMENFEITDNFSDGQLYVAGSESVELFHNGTATGPSSISATNVTLGTIDPATGLTEVAYDLSNIIATELPASAGVLDGDLVDGTQSGKTTALIKFRTQVQEEFQYPSVPGGNASVDVGDALTNNVNISSEVEGTGNTVTNVSTDRVQVDIPVATKSIYAINQDTDNWDTSDPEIAPGESITYRITVELPTSDVENLNITDYLPLPIFKAAPNYAYTGMYSGVDNVPAPGEYGFGPLTDPADFPSYFFDATGNSLDIASVTVSSTDNTVNWDFDAFSQPNSGGGVVDLLFTTATANVKFADGLSLTNQALVSYDNTNNPQEPIGSIISVSPIAPDIALTKGVVSVDSTSTGAFTPAAVGPVTFNDAGTAGAAFSGAVTSPGLIATPIDSDVSGLDAGDIVRFAITIENKGSFDATDITVNDNFPPEFAIPPGGLNMTAALGDGTPLAITGDLFNTSGLPDSTGVSFQQGGSTAYIGAGEVDDTLITDGSNIFVLTYDLMVGTNALPISTLENTADLLTFSAIAGGVDYTDGENNPGWTDDASVTTDTPSIDKGLTSSGIIDSTNPLNRAVPGEFIDYQVVITVPEGTFPAAQIRDDLDADVRFHEILGITSSADVTTSLANGFSDVVSPTPGTTGLTYFNLGDITNTNTDNSVDETITVDYRVYVKSDANDFALIRNRAYIFWDTTGNGNPNFQNIWDRAPNLRVVTPFLDVQKEITGQPPVDVGDTVTYSITIQHENTILPTSDTHAYNVNFSDTLPSEIGGISIVSVVDGSGAAVPGFTLSGNTIANPDFDLPYGESITVTVTGTVNSASAGAEVVNTADISWTTLDPDNPDDGIDAVEPTLLDSDSASYTVTDPILTKSVVSTGINSTTNNNAQVVNGEYVIYRLSISVPEGVTPTASIVDQLPSNIIYDPTFTPIITLSSGDFATELPGVPPTVSGGEVTFDLGTIKNSNNNNNVIEAITIEYRAYVSGAAPTDNPTNVADFRWDKDGDGSNTGPNDGSQISSTSLEVVEPILDVIKSVVPGTADAGDTVEYTIEIQHTPASETDAFDVAFKDDLPIELGSISLVSALDSGGAAVAGFAVVANTVFNNDFDLPLGETITLTVTGVAQTSISASTTVSNTAELEWDTLGDDTQGNQLAEDTRIATSEADFIVPSPEFTKTLVSTGIANTDNANNEVVAGEYATYQLEVTVPEGTTPLATIIDTLDEDLIFDPTYTVTVVASANVVFSGSPAAPSVSGSLVKFDFGTITNTNTDNAVDDTITITYRVHANRDLQLADVLINTAELQWDSDNDNNIDNNDLTLTSGNSLLVIAPELQVLKSISTVPIDAGDTVVYDYVISHTAASNATALDASFTDLLPPEIDAVSVAAVDGNGVAVPGFTIVPGFPQDAVVNPDYDLPEGETITVTVTGVVNTTASASTSVVNTGVIDWDSLGDDVEGNQDYEDSNSNSSSASFVVSSPTFTKSLASTGIDDASNAQNEVVAGEFVTYELRMVVPEGTTPMASIIDTLHADLDFDTAFGITAEASAGVLFTGNATSPTVAGNDVSFDLGTISNNNADNTVEDTIVITYRVYATAAVARGDILPNVAEFTWDSDNDGDIDTTDSLLTSGSTVQVIEPELVIDKSIATIPSDAGDAVVYTYSIEHTAASDAAALAASFTDLLPAEVAASTVAAVDSSGGAVAGFNIVSGTPQDSVVNTNFDLPLGETITVTVTGVVNTTASAGATVVNTGTIDWDTLSNDTQGNQLEEVTGSSSSSAQFVVVSPVFDKELLSTGIDDVSNDATHVVAGEYATYSVEIIVPEGTTPGATITDTLHANLRLDTGYSITTTASSGVAYTGSPNSPTVSGNDIVFDLGTITNTNTDNNLPETITIVYRVYADSDVLRGDTLDNNATFSWVVDDGATQTINTLSDSTDVTVIAPEMVVEKSVSQMPGEVGDNIEYTMVLRHTDAGDAPLPASDTAAYDVAFSDSLPAGLINPAIVSAVDSSNTAVSGFTLSGNTVSHAGLDIPLGETITLTVSAEAGAAIVEGQNVDNIAQINWTTLDDNSDDGFDAGEAYGSANDNAIFSLSDLEKSIVSTGIDDTSNDNTEVVTGEYVVYELIVTVPQGTSPLAEIEDTLDAGLIFDQAYPVTVSPSSVNLTTSVAPGDFSAVSTSYDAASGLISIDLGDISNAATGATIETLTVTYRAYVDNDTVNAPVGGVLNNDAEFKWDIDADGSNEGPLDGSTGAAAPHVDIIGNELQVSKQLTVVPTDAGDTVTYEMVISHSAASEAAAFDATFSDTLPAEVSSVAVISAVDGSGATVPGFAVSGNTVSNPDYDLPLGETITITVSGIVNSSASASSTVNNAADITWDSLGDDSQGVQGVETEGTATASDDFVVASPTFLKSIASTGINDSSNDNSLVVAGEYVTYDLVVVVPEGTTPLAQITDTLHANLLFDPNYTITAATSAGVSFTGLATTAVVSGSDVTFDLGTITNLNSNDTVTDTITINYRAYADQDVASAEILTNDATLIWDADADGDNNDNDGALTDTAQVSVITPQLVVEKDVSVMPSSAGDPLEYTIVIRHTGVADTPLPVSATSAYDVIFSDTLPPGVDNSSIVSALDSSGAAVAGFTLTGNAVSHPGFDLARNDYITLTIAAEAGALITAGDTVTNTAEIIWSTLDDNALSDGFDDAESGGDADDNAVFSLADIEKTIINTGVNDASNDNTEVVTGEYITYQLQLTVPHGSTPSAEIEDTLDAGLIFDQATGITIVPGSANLSTSSVPGDFSSVVTTYDAASNIISIDLGDITNSAPIGTVETLTITYRVYVDNDALYADVGDLLNNAVDFKWDIDGDGSNDGPTDGTTTSTAPDVVVIAPELQISKQVIVPPNDAGDTVTYEMVISHTGGSQAAAFDASFADTLPSEISNVSVVSAIDSSGATVAGFVVTGNTVSNPDYDLPLGETITLTVSGIVNTTASASTTVNNIAQIDWDTLGDDTQGYQPVEGTGTASASDDFVMASPTFEKSVADTGIDNLSNDNTEVVAGEFVTYDLVVTVPEGTTPMAQITDTLHANLLFDSSYAIAATGSAGVVFTGPATAPIVTGSNVVFDLGTITNTNTDDTAPDTITITYRAYADTDVVSAETLDNNATLIWDADNDGDNTDNDGVLTDTTDVTVIAANMLVEKAVTLMPADIGDTIEYTMVIRHSDASDAPVVASETGAYDVIFTDVLPAGLINPSVVSAVDSSNSAVSGFTVAGNTVNHAGLDIPLDEFITLTVSAEAGPSIVEGDTIDNIAIINWTTLDDAANDGFDAGESGGTDSDNANFSIGNIEKTVLNTGINDASNDNSEAVTGEYVTYQLSIEIPQGASAVAEIEDTLDAGLIFDQGFGVTVTPSSSNLTTNTAPGDFSNVATTYDPVTNLLSIGLGDVNNSAATGTVESLTVTYRVYVDNDIFNAPVGSALNNAVNYKWDIDGDGTNDGPLDGTTEAAAPEIEVIAPELEIAKQVIVVPADAGDIVTYEMVISHTGNSQAAAFDATFTDTLPSEISSVSIVSALDSSGIAVPGFVVSGNTVSHPDYDLALGDTITLTVTGVVNTTVSASTTVTNTASIDWDTLGDDSQGNQVVEDTGTDSASDDFIVASPAFAKSIAGTGINDPSAATENDNSEVVAGEYVTYDLVVTVPEGTTPMAQITDTLQNSLLFDSSYPITAVGTSGVAFTGAATVPTVSGNDITFDLGTITNSNIDDSIPDTITITYRAYSAQTVVSGDTLSNNATLTWDADNDGDNNDNDGTLSDSTDVAVIAPELVVEKSVSVMPSDIGDPLEYTIVIRHTDPGDAPLPVSETAAYDITFNDVLPAGIDSPGIVSALDSTGNTVPGFNLTGSTVTHTGFDLAHKDTVTLTLSGIAGSTIVEGDTVTNTANINWTTLNDTSDDGFDAGESGASETDSAVFSISDIEKRIVETGINDTSNDNLEAVSGEYVTYELVVTVPHGTSPVAEIEDTLDAGLVFDQANGVTVVPSSTNLTHSTAPGDFSAVAASYDAATNLVSFDLGDITNTAAEGTVETLTVFYRVYVANDAINAGLGATLNNAAEFKWDINGDGINDGPTDGTTEAVAPDVTIIGPELQLTKQVATVPSDAGDIVTYEMLIEHTGTSTAAAFDSTFSDTLPSEISNISIVSALDSSGAPVPGFSVSGNSVSNPDYDLALGDSITLIVTGTVNTTASASTTVINTANIGWETLGDDSQGNQSAQDSGTDQSSDSFVLDSPVFSKSISGTGINDSTNNNSAIVAGEYVTYDLVVTVPEGTTPLVQITDTLHSNLIFDPGFGITATGSSGVSFTGAAINPAVAGSDVIFDLGTVTNTNTDDSVVDTITITYRTYADSDVVAGDTLNNDATLIWDADNDGDNNDNDGALSDTSNVDVISPELIVDKQVTLIPSDIGDTVEYTVVIRHTDSSDAPLPESATSAYDVTLNDQLPAGLINAAIVSATDSAGQAVPGFALSGNTVSHGGFDLAHTDTVTLVVRAEAGAAIIEGDTVTNVADINWTTLDDATDDGIDASESGGSANNSASFSISDIQKTVLNTGINDASNNDSEVVTGEFVTYQLSVEIPHGTVALAEIEDTLDAGLIFDQANGVTVVPGSANLTTSNGSFTNSTTTYDQTSNLVSIELGDITNTAPVGTVETLTITYRVYVDNDTVNASVGDTLNNAVNFKWDINNDGDNDGPLDGTTEARAPDVTVIGTALQVSKQVVVEPNDAGDTITYEMIIEHTADSQAAAFDATFSDAIPSEISGVSVSAVNSAGTAVSGFAVSGNTVSNPDFDLPLGESIAVTITGVVNTTASASTTVTNTADISWESLGDDTQGRQLIEDGGTDSASDDFIVASPTFEKLLVSSGIEDGVNTADEVVAGEYVTYSLVVTVPEGTTPMAQITDTLNSFLTFDGTYAITAVASSGVSFTGNAIMPVINGSDVIFDLGTITNTNTADNIDDTVTVTYRVYTEQNVARLDVLENSATLIWDADNDGDNQDADGVLLDSTDVNVVEPQLVVDKQVTLMPSDIGDPLEYTIIIRHSDFADAPLAPSDASAYDVAITDEIPQSIENVVIVSAVNSFGVPIVGFALNGNTVSHAGFDLPHSDFVTLTISGTAGSAIVEGDTVTNVTDINWSTLDDTTDDGIDAVESGGSASNDASFSLANVEKSILSTGINDASNNDVEVVSGEYVTYQLTVEVPHGTAAVAEIEDTLDAGLILDQSIPVTVTPSSANLSTSTAPGDFSVTATSYDPTSNKVSIALGDINNAAPVGTVEMLTITYRVIVDSDTTTAGPGAVLNNAVDFRFDIDGDGSNDGPLDGSTEDSAPTVEVISPELTITKQVVVAPQDAGDTVAYEMLIEHTDASQAGAFDATFTDTLPAEVSMVSVVSAFDSVGNAVGGFAVSGNTVSNPDFDLPLGESITLTVTGTINTIASASTTVNNTALITWDTLGDDTQGNQSFENGGTDSDNDVFTVASPTFEKTIESTGIANDTNDNGEVVAGEYVTYNLIATVPEGTTPLVQITDILDPDLLFDSSYSISATGSNGVTFTGAATSPTVNSNTVVFDLGTVTNTNIDNNTDDTVTITYRVFTDSDVATDAVLPNNATLEWDANNNALADEPNDGSLTDGTSVTVISPQLVVEKSVSEVPGEQGDPIQYTFVIRHSDASDAPLPLSQTGAYDIAFNDPLPAGLSDLSVDSAILSDGTPITGFTFNGNTLSHTGFDLNHGDSLTLTVSGIVGTTVVEGDTIVNIADISWSTLDDNSDDGIDASESGGSGSGGANFTLSNLEKSIVSTGINDFINNDLHAVAGEFIDYQVVLEVPKGLSAQAEIIDQLDAGLVFDTTQGITALPSSSNITTSLQPGDFSELSANYDPQTNSVNVLLGDITNIAPASVIETITLEYRVYVANDEATAGTGEWLNNTVNFRWDIDGDGSNTGLYDGITQASAPEVAVISPELDIVKTVIEDPGENGDAISYEFVISHSADSTATAYDMQFVDEIPAGVSGLVINSAVDSSNNPVNGFTVDGNTLQHAGLDLIYGDTVTVSVSGTINETVDPGDTITNTATITWRSLDSGNDTDGADVIDPNAAQLQSNEASDSFSIADLHKRVIDTSIDDNDNAKFEAVVGEYITYELVIDVPQGVSSFAEIQDTLDQGMAFDSLIEVVASSDSLSTDHGVGDFSDIVAPLAGSTDTLLFPLGEITNTNLDNSVTETLTLTYRVYVQNENTVQPGVTLGNDAVYRWDLNGDGVADNVTNAKAAAVTVLEPVISVSKTANDPVPHLGQVITYTVTVANEPVAYGADARDVSVIDALPANAVLDPASILINGVAVTDDTNVTDLSSGNTVALSLDNLEYGAEVAISYQALLTADTNEFGGSVDNTVSVQWSSLSEANPNDGLHASERDSSDGLAGSAGNSIILTAPDYKIEKASAPSGALKAGDSIVYTLSVSNIGTHEGTNIEISDLFPVEALGAPGVISNNGSFDAITGHVNWLIPTLAINENVILTVEATVANPQDTNIDANTATADDTFTNTATVTDDGLNGGDPDLTNNEVSVSGSIIAAPDYTISKTNNSTMAAPTERVNYFITASNIGTQTGTNVVITDEFPPAILTIIDAAGGVIDEQAGTITWVIDEFSVGQEQQLAVIAEVKPTANLDTADQLFTNSVSITDDLQNGADTNTTNNDSTESDMLLAGAGEPLMLTALPESIGASPLAESSAGSTTDSANFRLATPDTARIMTTEMLTGQGTDENERNRRAENDLINGGHLLDTFSVPSPAIHCSPGVINYDYESDQEDLELLEWLQEAESEEARLEVEPSAQGSEASHVELQVNGVVKIIDEKLIEQPQTLQQQIAREADNLYGSDKKELLEAFKDSA